MAIPTLEPARRLVRGRRRAFVDGKRELLSPTKATMLHLCSISTTEKPPSSKSRRICAVRCGWHHLVSSLIRPLQETQNQGLTVSLKGSQLNIRKPVDVPHAKHSESWLKETKLASSSFLEAIAGGRHETPWLSRATTYCTAAASPV